MDCVVIIEVAGWIFRYKLQKIVAVGPRLFKVEPQVSSEHIDARSSRWGFRCSTSMFAGDLRSSSGPPSPGPTKTNRNSVYKKKFIKKFDDLILFQSTWNWIAFG